MNHEFKFIVLSHSSSSNALGRAQSMALVAQEIGPTEVWAKKRSGWWQGATQFPTQQVMMDGRPREIRSRLEALGAPNAQLVIWVCKGLDPLPAWAMRIRKAVPSALLVLDIDDDDAGLAVEYRAGSYRRRIQLNLARAGHPTRVRRAQRRLWRMCDAVTFASRAVRRTFPAFSGLEAWIPHVRPMGPSDNTGSSSSAQVRVGVFGTIRPHKGRDLILDLMRSNRDFEISAFRGSGLGTPTSEDTNWIEIPPDTPLSDVYRGIDVALLPMTATVAADVQFPAKLVDALRAGVAVVATKTTAIDEIAAGSYVELPSNLSGSGLRALLLQAAISDAGQRGRKIFVDRLTPEASAQTLREMLAAVANHPGQVRSSRASSASRRLPSRPSAADRGREARKD